MKRLFTLMPLFACALAAQAPPLARLQSVVPAASRTQIMVLGTFHYRDLKDTFKPGMAEPVLKALEAFRPDVIAVEVLPGAHIHELELRANATSIHQELLDTFAGPQLKLGHEAQALLKLDASQAARALPSLPPAPESPSEWARRTLHHLAAYELPTALLAWSHLSPQERTAQTALPAAMASQLDAQLARINEMPALALPLAKRLGHREIACVDEFEDPAALDAIMPGLEAERTASPELSGIGKAQVYADLHALEKAAGASGDLMPLYRFLNSPTFAAADVDAQWGAFLRAHLKNGTDRGRMALWENRNLKIAARIQALKARYPGKRILVIYGAAHKPFLEAYLSACSDVRLVQPSLPDDASKR